MTDQEHCDAINAARLALGDAIIEARAVGLGVGFENKVLAKAIDVVRRLSPTGYDEEEQT